MSVLALEYQEAGGGALALPPVCSQAVADPVAPVIMGVPEDEVDRRVEAARAAAVAEADQRVRIECEMANERAQKKIAAVLREFSEERRSYFKQIEAEVVQLALAIARKILQREAQMDPMLLAALVRIAIDRMQCGTTIRIRVAEENAEPWRRYQADNEICSAWQVVEDTTLSSDDCIVETELGSANFGFAAQLRDVEESFMRLVSHRPGDTSRHAAAA